MRPVTQLDISILARCLLAVPKIDRCQFASQKVAFTQLADDFRKRTGRRHPILGDGTLQSTCQGSFKAKEAFWDDPDYASCIIMALEVVCDAVVHASNARTSDAKSY